MSGIPERPELRAFLTSLTSGETLSGTVAAIEPFGAFVRLSGGIEGFVHLQHLAAGPEEPVSEVVQAGEEMSVVVIAVDGTRRRLSLGRQQKPPAGLAPPESP